MMRLSVIVAPDLTIRLRQPVQLQPREALELAEVLIRTGTRRAVHLAYAEAVGQHVARRPLAPMRGARK